MQLYFLGKCLKVVNTSMDWESAFNNCKQENAELATILSSEESQFVNG